MERISFTHVGYIAQFLHVFRALGLCTAKGMDYAVNILSKRIWVQQ